MQNQISFATWEMKKELVHLWQVCFDEEEKPTAFFFQNAFLPEHCLVTQIHGKVAAMLHMLPGAVWDGRQVQQAHYIYGAGTLPEYRGHGVMAQLLESAAEYGKKRGDKASFLLPANESLYRYYQKSGYHYGFSIKKASLSRAELTALAGQVVTVAGVDACRIAEQRTNRMRQITGSVLWNEAHIAYASGINRVYGGRLIAAETGNHFGYALCRMEKEGVCEITELIAQEDTFPLLAGRILEAFSAMEYHFRMPVDSTWLDGTISRFGMIKPLDSNLAIHPDAYLGLTLD